MWHPESIFDASGHLEDGVVHAWLDDQLAPDAAAQVEQHAAACASCSAMVAEARGLIAGASRVMASLDEPAVDRAPAREAMIGIVAAAGQVRPAGEGSSAGTTSASGWRRHVRRWSTRRISLAAAAAFVFVTGTLVLRDSGAVREMVEADQLVISDTSVGVAESAQATEAVAGAASAIEPAESGRVSATGAAKISAPAPGRPSGRGATGGETSAGEASAGEASAGGRAAGTDAAAGFRSSAPPPSVERDASRFRAESDVASPPAPAPVPAPAPAAPQAAVGATTVVTPTGAGRGEEPASDQALKAREVAASREAATRAIRAQVADERRQLQPPAVQSSPALAREPHRRVTRTSAEIQAMVRMVSSCWRVAGTDSVLELLPPDSRSAAPGAPGGSPLWISGWLRMRRDATNPDRIWWLPLGDSVSARIRLEDGTRPDMVITPRGDAALLWRVPRSDSLAAWAAIPRGEAVESATSVRCLAP